jgi:uncharacterized protein (DUF1330 family)
MAAYAIFVREKTKDAAEMQVYSGLAGGTLAGHTVKVLAVYGKQEVLEGPPCEGVVILQFPAMEAAKAWYDSPAYQAARKHRFKGADYRVIFVEGM